MNDPKLLRREPDRARKGVVDRGGRYLPALDEYLAGESRQRAKLADVEAMRAKRNESSKAIGKAKNGGDEEAAAREAGLDVSFVRSDVRSFLQVERTKNVRAELVVANPPRTGLDEGAVRELIKYAPARVVVVSCDPPTLARDARKIVDAGYAIQRVVPLDMFPQTGHVETVMLLVRRG